MKSPLAGCGRSDRAPWTTAGASLPPPLVGPSRISGFHPRALLFFRRRSEVNASKAAYSHVASWADRYLDSGVSLTMDMAGSDYDSEDSSGSHETVHRSYSYIPSDAEVRGRAGCNRNWLKSSRKGRSDLCFFFFSPQVLEMKSEAAQPVTPSRGSSIASSLRRRLSAFSAKVKYLHLTLIHQN